MHATRKLDEWLVPAHFEKKRTSTRRWSRHCILNFEESLCVKCRQNTHSHDTFAHVQLITARTAQIQSLITRTRVAQVVCFGASKAVCHPNVMSHMLPHLPQNTSARSLSLSLSSTSRVLSRPILEWSMKPCETHGGVADTLNLHLPQV